VVIEVGRKKETTSSPAFWADVSIAPLVADLTFERTGGAARSPLSSLVKYAGLLLLNQAWALRTTIVEAHNQRSQIQQQKNSIAG
jgi:hypothetical protein